MMVTISAWFSFVSSLITVPTAITLVRILCVPIILACMMAHNWAAASLFFVIASFTDLIDGALARYLGQESFFGAFLDPIADKLLLISSFTGFALYYKASAIPVWFLLFLIFSELIVVFLAFYWGVIKKSMVIKPTRLGRLTSFGQILVIGWLLWCSVTQSAPTQVFWLLLGLVVIARLCTYIDYAYRAFFVKGSAHD
jgi:cardiolipin synthase